MSNPTRSAWSSRAALILPVVLAVGACSTAGSSAGASAPGEPSTASGSSGAVSATETEFKIDLGASTAAAGPVTFEIQNAGTVVHEFVVMKTDLAADKLPLDTSAGVVSEDTDGLTVVDEVEDIQVGSSASLTVDLPAGHYVLICNVPAHYAAGMRADFTTD